ncbi:CRISPR-associated protein Csh2 [Clostridium cavendishii DSM 21758]|uniref:CRISPR-associated protein Csh2 n=1 Tax=Clostridium cavendishii DSM 21758 TaxID=1121302 RepID=A0A1M6VDJ2_9CLOT|nr:type I CRISPR-associated protein Cas7 [Clostridium cavendishii]SHK79508.1 CRISPR-associated protein Csh2 [Clostridium cavendishii DSM 21758]
MEKRVYGVLGIKSIMANWNADFSGYPKSISNGDIFGSDKAFKYPMKRCWDEGGKKVLYIKSLKVEEDKKEGINVRPKSLKERYEEIFNVPNLKDAKDTKEVLKNLFTAIDVKNFGATFAEEGKNISITGAVQIGQGFNKYKDISVEEQQILSPFRDGKESKGEANATTLGTKIVSDEAHYFYPFAINPTVYKSFVEMGVTEGYTEADYSVFKEAALASATAFNTNSKVGCENEFAIFVETEKELYLPDLAQYITFRKEEDKNVIILGFEGLLNELNDRIKSIEVYYNNYNTKLEGNIEKAKYFNIFTRKEV